jgi:rRNA maturation endonuclease Nob1
MGKVCIACGAVPENPDPEMEKENCPGCGGEGTVQEEGEEKGGMDDGTMEE